MILKINEEKKVGISHFFREEWTEEKPINIQISSIRLKIGSESNFWENLKFQSIVNDNNFAVIDCKNVRLVFFNGQIEWQKSEKRSVVPVNEPWTSSLNINTEKGFWVIFLQHLNLENNNQTEYFRTIFRQCFGNYIIENNGFYYTYTFNEANLDGTYSFRINYEIHAIDFFKPSQNSLKKLVLFDKIINEFEEEKFRNKIKLSFNWFSKTHEENEIDKFMFFWIAIEILTMNDNSDIKPLILLLDKAYYLERPKVDRFCIGKICGLRGRIFHNGFKPTFDFEFLYFCDLLYFDCVNEILGQECEQLALNYLNNEKEFNLEKFLDKKLKEYKRLNLNLRC